MLCDIFLLYDLCGGGGSGFGEGGFETAGEFVGFLDEAGQRGRGLGFAVFGQTDVEHLAGGHKRKTVFKNLRPETEVDAALHRVEHQTCARGGVQQFFGCYPPLFAPFGCKFNKCIATRDEQIQLMKYNRDDRRL